MPDKQLKSIVLALAFAFSFTGMASAQKGDSASVIHKDSLKPLRKSSFYPDPHKAMIYSVILPGLGQAYNKKWWKVGIIYAGLGTCAYFAVTNTQQYNVYHNALVGRGLNQTGPTFSFYSNTDLISIEGYYDRYRDLSYIAAGFIYILGIVDANVDAQLHNFDVSNNISFHFTPQLYNNYSTGKYGIQPGFCLVKRF